MSSWILALDIKWHLRMDYFSDLAERWALLCKYIWRKAVVHFKCLYNVIYQKSFLIFIKNPLARLVANSGGSFISFCFAVSVQSQFLIFFYSFYNRVFKQFKFVSKFWVTLTWAVNGLRVCPDFSNLLKIYETLTSGVSIQSHNGSKNNPFLGT